MPITITHNQFMALSPEGHTQILNLIAAQQNSTPSTPLAIPVTLPPQPKYNQIIMPMPEPELAVPRPSNQETVSDIRTSTQSTGEACATNLDKNAPAIETSHYLHTAPAKVTPHTQPLPLRGPAIEHTLSSQPASAPAHLSHCVKAIAYAHGSHNVEACVNMPTNALVATECTATAHDTTHSVYKVPPIAFIDPQSTVVRTHLIESYISPLLAPASQSKNEACTAMAIGLTESATIAPSLSLNTDLAACDSKLALNPSHSLPSKNTCIATQLPPLKISHQGSPRHVIFSELLTSLLSRPLQLMPFSNPADFAFFPSFSSYIVSPSQFLPAASKISPKRPSLIDVIIYPPHKSARHACLNPLVNSTPTLANTMFCNLFSAAWLIATTLALLHTTSARMSHLFRFASPASIAICLLLGIQTPASCCALCLRFQHTVGIVAQVMSFRCTPIYHFHENIVLAFSSPCHFTLGGIFISVAPPRPLKPDRPRLPASLHQATHQPHYSSPAPVSLMTEDSHY